MKMIESIKKFQGIVLLKNGDLFNETTGTEQEIIAELTDQAHDDIPFFSSIIKKEVFPGVLVIALTDENGENLALGRFDELLNKSK